MIFSAENGRLSIRRGTELVWIEPWGEDSLRVRATRRSAMTGRDWALMEPVPKLQPTIEIREIDATEPWYRDRPDRQRTARVARIENGAIAAEVDEEGWITFVNAKGEVLAKEYWRQHKTVEFDSLMERKYYVIFAAFNSADYDEDEEGFRYNADIQYKLETRHWLEEIEENKLYDTGIDVAFGDEFLTLTTCYRVFHRNGRFVVVCRKIREGETFE